MGIVIFQVHRYHWLNHQEWKNAFYQLHGTSVNLLEQERPTYYSYDYAIEFVYLLGVFVEYDIFNDPKLIIYNFIGEIPLISFFRISMFYSRISSRSRISPSFRMEMKSSYTSRFLKLSRVLSHSKIVIRFLIANLAIMIIDKIIEMTERSAIID